MHTYSFNLLLTVIMYHERLTSLGGNEACQITQERIFMERKFSASESDIIFNTDTSNGITFETIALWLEDITGKTTTAEDVEREFDARC